MIITIRNVRGLHKPQKQALLADKNFNLKTDLVGLLETKLNDKIVKLFVAKYLKNWNFFDNFDTVKGGRILIFWNPNRISIDMFVKEKQLIAVHATCLLSNSKFDLFVCYGFWKIPDRRDLWDSLLINCDANIPSIVTGDFNCILDPSERVGGRTPLERE